jgi:hypothetical protein
LRVTSARSEFLGAPEAMAAQSIPSLRRRRSTALRPITKLRTIIGTAGSPAVASDERFPLGYFW